MSCEWLYASSRVVNFWHPEVSISSERIGGWKSWSGPVWKSFAICRLVKREKEEKERTWPGRFALLEGTTKNIVPRSRRGLLTISRDPCNSAAFLFSPATIFRRRRAAHVMRSLCNRYTHRARRRLSFVSRNSRPFSANERSNPFHPWILSILSISTTRNKSSTRSFEIYKLWFAKCFDTGNISFFLFFFFFFFEIVEMRNENGNSLGIEFRWNDFRTATPANVASCCFQFWNFR